MDEPRAGSGRGHPLVEKPQSLSARTPVRHVSVAPETPDSTTAPGASSPSVGRVRRRHRTWEGSSTKLMVAEQKEIREREMLAEMGRGRSSTSITGKLASLLPSLYSRHSSDSGFHSRRGEEENERIKMGNVGGAGGFFGGAEFFVTDSRPPSLQVSRSASRAESQASSIFSSDCLEVNFYFIAMKMSCLTSQDDAEPSVRVVPGGDVTESYRLGTLLGEGAFSKVSLFNNCLHLKHTISLWFLPGFPCRKSCRTRWFGSCQGD